MCPYVLLSKEHVFLSKMLEDGDTYMILRQQLLLNRWRNRDLMLSHC